MTYSQLVKWYLELHEEFTTIPMDSPRMADVGARLALVRQQIASLDALVSTVTSPIGNYPKA